MKKTPLFLTLTAIALCTFSACKDHFDHYLLVGDWRITSAISSDGEEIIGVHSGFYYTMTLHVTKDGLSLRRLAVNPLTDVSAEVVLQGEYSWGDDRANLVLRDQYRTLSGYAEIEFPTDNQLNLKFLWENGGDGDFHLIKAERQ